MSDATADPVEQLSDVERHVESWRRRVGLFAAPVMFFGMLALPMPSLEPAAHRLAAIMSTVILLWITEAVPMPVTSLAGVAACVLLGVGEAKAVFAPFAEPLIFLFIGSFMLARAIFLHRLDRRLAFGVLSLRWVGGRPSRILFVFGAVTAFISAWISNTATTAMMFAIGMSILGFLLSNERAGGSPINRRYATGIMLMTSFSASIGGLATPIGTPPNVIGLGFIRQELGVEFPFFKWTMIGVPVVVCLFLFLFVYLNFFCRAGVAEIAGSHELLERERASLGPWTTGQKSTAAAFLVTVALWVVPGLFGLIAGDSSTSYRQISKLMPEGVAAIFGAVLLFLLPGDRGKRALAWHQAVEIDWGVILLYGGGLALGSLASQTGLADAVGHRLAEFLPNHSDLGLLIAATLIATLVSEATSNTASATIVTLLAIKIARDAGVDPLEPALGATMGASLGFMLPVSTPCNAIVYGSGYVPITRMIRYGLLLDVAGVVVIVTMVKLLVPLLR